MRSLLISWLGQQSVDRISLISQFILLLTGAAGFYETRTLSISKGALRSVGSLQRFFWYGKWGFVVGHAARTRADSFTNFLPGILFLSAFTILGLAFVAGDTVVYWSMVPIWRLLAGFSAWNDLTFAWSALLIPLRFLGNIGLGLFLFLLVYAGGFGIPIRAALVAVDEGHKHLSGPILHGALCLIVILAGVAVILTSGDW